MSTASSPNILWICSSVDCNLCHASPMGWNSSKVTIPPSEDPYIADSALVNTTIMVPGWGGDCGYCHKRIANLSTLHEIHEPVIETACVGCHGDVIKSVPSPIKAAVVEGEVPPEIELSRIQKLALEYYFVFEGISTQLLDFYNFMRE